MRSIVAVTGIRSEYDIMYSVYKTIESHPELSLSLIVTGAHLSDNYGRTIDQIREDGFKIGEIVENLIDGNRHSSRVKGAALQMYGLAQAVDRLQPDLLLAFGDREESITTAMVGCYLNIPVIHIGGGDRVIGNADDSIRHAVTKLAHLHLTTNEESRQRILKMGEQPFRVFNVGNPGLDRLNTIEIISRSDLLKWYGFKKETERTPLLLVIQHPLSSEVPEAYRQMKITLEAVQKLGFNTVLSYPNSDPGSHDMIRCIQEYKELPFLKVFKNIPRIPFVNTLRQVSCLVGNSSLSLLEAPFLKLPAVNVGNRQKARLHAENMQFVPHDMEKIIEAIEKACFDKAFKQKVASCSNPYGDGQSSERIVKLLSEIELNNKLLLKDITY